MYILVIIALTMMITMIITLDMLVLFVWRARKEASPTPEGPLLKLGENYSSVGQDCGKCSPDSGDPGDLVN